jgi:hypothetical protein
MLPVRYELNVYILFRRNSVFKGLNNLLSLKLITKIAYVVKSGFDSLEHDKTQSDFVFLKVFFAIPM